MGGRAPLDRVTKREPGGVPMGEAVASQQLHCQGDEDALSGRAVDAIVTPDAACAPRGAAGAERAFRASVSRVPSPLLASWTQLRQRVIRDAKVRGHARQRAVAVRQQGERPQP